MPFEDAEVPTSSCYVMPIMIEQDGRQAEVASRLRERGIQTSIFYPSIHRFTAYRERFPDVSLPITELASRTELTLPFYPHMTHEDQDRVVDGARRGGRADERLARPADRHRRCPSRMCRRCSTAWSPAG